MKQYGLKFSSSLLGLGLSCVAVWSHPALAKKGSAMIYEDPFDLGAGGASLTRASQAAILISNPALLPYGDGFHRWVGIEPSLIAGKDSADFARSMSSNEKQETSALIETLSKTPIHFGVSNAASYLNRGFGLGVYNRFEPDLSVHKYGETGLPEVDLAVESYQSVAVSGASLIGSKALSFGMTAKYLYAAEPELNIEITDQEKIEKLTSSEGISSLTSHNTGVGVDAGLILFKQGMNLDGTLALKVDDLGGTSLSGKGELVELPQMMSAGVSTTLHNATDALHFAIDYRDLQGAYEEKLFKRVRVGTKLLIRRYVGISAGMRDGWPTYGAELDLILVRISASYYTRELGDGPGVDPRTMYSLGLAMGF